MPEAPFTECDILLEELRCAKSDAEIAQACSHYREDFEAVCPGVWSMTREEMYRYFLAHPFDRSALARQALASYVRRAADDRDA